MAYSLNRTETIWLFGKRLDFVIFDCGVNLNPIQMVAGPFQKNQIVLHATDGNNPATGAVNYWNLLAAGPWYCPNYFTGAPRHFFSNDHPGNCPAGHGELQRFFCPKFSDPHDPHHFGSSTAGDCPDGHGTLVVKPLSSSAHYVIERADNHTATDGIAGPAHPYANVVEVADSGSITWQGERTNNTAIGIEHSNVCSTFANFRGDADGAGAAKRPRDRNQWLHLDNPRHPDSNLERNDYQAYEEEQYPSMILLLRYLCLKHRIPRRFLGDTTDKKMQRYWSANMPVTAATRELMRFRGILSHMNCSTKDCGGPAMNRNRLFRGITDEWWLPVEVDNHARGYYMGPFDVQANKASFYRWNGRALRADLFHDADLDALQDTRSYYNLDRTQWYYAKTEDPHVRGTFPIGTNKVWHGGVHFESPNFDNKVYAAASGTIVAARLGSNQSIEDDPDLGSQRFVLIRHCVYWQQEPDPGGGRRTNFAAVPSYVFTLYMHLDKFDGDLETVSDKNPQWFNYWLNHRAAKADANAVFCPDVQVSVGDWLGFCGKFRGKNMLHFEVMSKVELTDAPWDNAAHRIVDNDANLICDSPTLNQFVNGNNITLVDLLRAAPQLRLVKSFHKSEWALSDASALTPVLPSAKERDDMWKKLKFMMWIPDAVAACPDLSAQLCDARGMMWHYHPVTFMDYINQLVQKENSQLSEADYKNTNVTIEDAYLTKYVDFATGAAVSKPADNKPVRPFAIADAGYADPSEYHFTRLDLACKVPAPHDPPDDPPKQTKFHIALLEALETTRITFNAAIKVTLSHVCPAHNNAANNAHCVLGTSAALNGHAAGHAVDIRPAVASQASCRSLWQACQQAATALRAVCGDHGGEASHPELQGHVHDLTVSTTADVQSKMNAGTALTAAEINAFTIHLELIESVPKVVWMCWLRIPTKATSVRVAMFDVYGIFPDQASAKAETVPGKQPVEQPLGSWETVIVTGTRAGMVFIRNTGVVGVFNDAGDAESEAPTGGHAWSEMM